VVGGCATLTEPLRSNLDSASPSVQACSAWYLALDRTIDEEGVRDAGAHRIPGFPYLRVDRLSASLREAVKVDEAAFGEWVDRLRALDATARSYEIGNLPEGAAASLGAGSKPDVVAKTERCADELQRADLDRAENRGALLTAAVVPDDYVEGHRVLGLYALSRVPFGSGVDRWHREVEEMFRRSKESVSATQPVMRYGPPAAAPASRDSIARLLSRGGRSRLGIREFSADELEFLFSAYAPVFEIETGDAYDRPGALAWRSGPAPSVDATRPVVYRRLAHTRHNGHMLVQLVYTVWFSERPHAGAFDVLAGRLDGVVWRVTLAPDGEPLVHDTIHPCGCYHMFFPTPRAAAIKAPVRSEEWALIPGVLPRVLPPERVRVRIATKTHYVINVGVDGGGDSRSYEYLEDDSLRSLAMPDGSWRSAFGPDGLVPGTERRERLFFWPMGIPSAGAMRQWGHHATAFIGRRHFDDADLIERRFELLPR
jgi:hypothetical protein